VAIEHRCFRLLRAAVVTATCAAACVAGTQAIASATGVTASGTIVYDKNGDVWQITPDGTTTHQVTTDGGTPTADNTGDTGYTVPTESDDGLIVAVRNQEFNKGQASEYTQGFLWEMDRSGNVIRKFKPAQFNYIPGGSCNPAVLQLPLGIINATVSPDGQHIAYTATTYVQSASCDAVQGYSSWIVNADGTGAHIISDGTSSAALEIGRWVSDTRLLVDRASFGSIENYYVDLPGYTATGWMTPGDFIDEAYLQPDVANGVLATDGYSEGSSALVIRVWPTSSYNSTPSTYCEYTSVANPGDIHDNLNQPSLSPDGAYVAFEDYNGTAPDTLSEGIYLAPAAGALTSNTACANAHSSLFIQGAMDPFWTSASITQTPPDTTPPTASLTAPTAAGIAASSVRVAWTGHDDLSGVASYQLRYRVANYSGGFSAWASPASFQGLSGTSANISGLQAGKDYCFSIRATDGANNTGAWSAARCVAVALDDRALSASAGWHRQTGTAYYLHTITSSTQKGAALSRTGASVDRVGVVATTCPSCGSVALYVGSTKIGSVSLRSATIHHKVIKLLPTFLLRSGTVSVKVLSAGKSVGIDGLLLSRS
jgi:hypothetical protein